jgi:hypothetical protein
MSNKPTSRARKKCRFGPRALKSATAHPLANNNPPLPEEDNIQDRELVVLTHNKVLPHYSFPPPDRVTLMPPGPSHRTPLDCYKQTAANAP